MLTMTYGLFRAGMSRLGRVASARRGQEVRAVKLAMAAAALPVAGRRNGQPPEPPAKPAREHLRSQFAADLREAGTIPPLDLGRRPLLLRDPVGTGALPQDPA